MSGGVPFGAAVSEHLQGCAECAELFQDEGLLGRGLAVAALDSPWGSALARGDAATLLESERGVRAYLRSRSTRVRCGLSFTLPLLLLAREALRGRVPLRSLGAPRLLGGLLLVGLLGVSLRSALQPLPVERRAARLRSVLAFVAWCLPCILWFAPEAPVSTEELSSGFALRSVSCFAYGSALAAPSFALLWAFDRGPRISPRVWALGAGIVALAANCI